MGSLFSRPKAPSLPQVVYEPPPPPAPVYTPAPVYIPQPVYVPPSPVELPSTPVPAAPPTIPTQPSKPDPAVQESEARVENLLRRRRGRAGTVETSWRGVLEQTAFVPPRKTLLGD